MNELKKLLAPYIKMEVQKLIDEQTNVACKNLYENFLENFSIEAKQQEVLRQ